ncbi:MAG: DEAD/DEAH box helicase [Spirochaetaceae bacterium]|jgi:superfamily II DNA/RNA helicase|nr:DEAD/DEAH box helicase [Spirochaetaceae bacterium]
MSAFAALGVDALFVEKLLSRSIRKPSAIQGIVIPKILDGHNVLFSSATGTGKTFAYLLPVLQMMMAEDEPQALIITPTIELAVQIKSEVDFLLDGLSRGMNSALFIGSANKEKQIESIKMKRAQIIIGNTSRVVQLATEKKLRLNKIRFLVLDEADRLISDEMHPQTGELFHYLNIHRTEPLQCICCSATMSERTQKKLALLLDPKGTNRSSLTEGKAESALGTLFLESNVNDILQNYISHWALWSEERDKPKILRSFLSAARARKTLVFAGGAEEISKLTGILQSHKVKAAALYSGMDKKLRREALDSFRAGSADVLVSSDLAARGLDIREIKYVVSIGVPADNEIYIHRAGRTGRAGRRGIIVSIGNETDLRRLSAIEKSLGIAVYPKILYNGAIHAPDELQELEEMKDT